MFKKAIRAKSHLRLALYGPSGSGKTYTALRIACALGKPVALIDTEHGSASKYAGENDGDNTFEFDQVSLTSFEPEKYITAIKEAAKAGYPTLVIDSGSHAWMGKGGLLDQADAKGGRFDAWKTLTPKHREFLEAILSFPGDVVVTFRTKTDYVVEINDKGKQAPRKVGLAPIQRDGMEYEFDVAGLLDMENVLHVEKSRCSILSGTVHRKPGAEIAKTLRDWLDGGVDAPVVSTKPALGYDINAMREAFTAAHLSGDDAEYGRLRDGAIAMRPMISKQDWESLMSFLKALRAPVAVDQAS